MMDLLICLIERKKMKIILINIILIIFMVFLYKYLKKKTNTYFSKLKNLRKEIGFIRIA